MGNSLDFGTWRGAGVGKAGRVNDITVTRCFCNQKKKVAYTRFYTSCV